MFVLSVGEFSTTGLPASGGAGATDLLCWKRFTESEGRFIALRLQRKNSEVVC